VAQDQGASDAALTSPSYRLKRAAGRAPRASRSLSKTRLDCRADRLQVTYWRIRPSQLDPSSRRYFPPPIWPAGGDPDAIECREGVARAKGCLSLALAGAGLWSPG
jgi:hypothetical protein